MMRYRGVTMSRYFQTDDGRGVTVPEGKWVSEFYTERHVVPRNQPKKLPPPMPDPQVIGLTGDEQERFHTRTYKYPTSSKGWTKMDVIVVVSDKPFAVIWTNEAGSNYVFATVLPSRQVQKRELGRHPPIKNFPKIRRRTNKQTTNPRAWVKWRDVASRYGEPDLWKLWRQFMPFSERGSDTDVRPVCYEDTGTEGSICYPHPMRFPRQLKHWSERFDNASVNASPARIQELGECRRWELSEHIACVQARRYIPDVLWDDPVLQLEHVSVPANFAKSILYCRQFDYTPDFTELMAAMAHYQAGLNR